MHFLLSARDLVGNAQFLTVFLIQVAVLIVTEVINLRRLRTARRQNKLAVSRGRWLLEVWAMAREDVLLAIVGLIAGIGILVDGNPALALLWTGQNEGFFVVGLAAYLAYVTWRARNVVPLANDRLRRLLRLPIGVPLWIADAWFFVAITAIWLLYPSPLGLVAALVAAEAWRLLRPQGWDEGLSSFMPAVGVILAGLVAGTVAGTFAWVKNPSNEAVTQTIAVQLVLGAIPISVSLALVPAAMSRLGLRGVSAVPTKWSMWSLACLVLSVGADVALLGDSAHLGSYRLELAQSAAALVVIAAGLAVYLNYRAIDADRVVETLMGRLDSRWLERVRARGQFGRGAFGPDPFAPVERLLSATVTRDRDRTLFESALDQLEDRIAELLFPAQIDLNQPDRVVGPDIATEEAFDLYLADNLRALAGEVFANKIDWAASELLWIRERLEPRPQRAGSALDRGGRA